MKRRFIGVGISIWLILFAAVPQARAILYEGYLTGSGGGITASDGWDDPSTRFSWAVSDVGVQNGNVLWQYDYLFQVTRKNISHFIVEVSPDVTNDQFSVLAGSSAGVQLYGDEGKSNPNIPELLWGIKFEDGTLTLAASFQTTLAPVWGDFYAKDGEDEGIPVTAWNTGFTIPDPIDGPANGFISNHILRPDTSPVKAPEPSTMLLLGLGVLGIAGLRRKLN